MSRYCPIVDHKVTYQFCEDCEDYKCRNKEKEDYKEKDEYKDKKACPVQGKQSKRGDKTL